MEPEIKVKGRRQARMTDRKVRTKKSNWLLTISTNQRYADSDEHLADDEEIFEEAILRLLNNLGDFVKINQEGHSWSKSVIEKADTDYVIERGGKTKALHCHILVKIHHTSNLRLDYDKIKNQIKDDLELNNVYINAKLVRPSSDDWLEEYIDKMR